MTLYDDAINIIDLAIRERYNVTSTDELAPFADAIKSAREGDLTALEGALAGREMYRWKEAISAQLAEAHRTWRVSPEVDPEPDEDPEPKAKSLGQQNKAELLATAAERGVKVPEGATVADLRAALAPVGFEAPEEEPEKTEPDFAVSQDADEPDLGEPVGGFLPGELN